MVRHPTKISFLTTSAAGCTFDQTTSINWRIPYNAQSINSLQASNTCLVLAELEVPSPAKGVGLPTRAQWAADSEVLRQRHRDMLEQVCSNESHTCISLDILYPFYSGGLITHHVLYLFCCTCSSIILISHVIPADGAWPGGICSRRSSPRSAPEQDSTARAPIMPSMS